MKQLRATTIALVFVALPAVAEEIQFGLTSATEYDTDVTTQLQDDVIFTFGPQVEITGEHRRFDYVFRHQSEFEAYGQSEAFNDWRHRTLFTGTGRLHPKLSLEITERLSVAPSASSFDEFRAPGSDPLLDPEIEPFRRDDVLTNVFRVSLTATPTSRLVMVFDVNHFFREFDNPTASQQSTESVTLSTQTLYRWSESHTFGAGFRFRRRLFETGDSDGQNSTDIYDVFGIWRWKVTERTSFSFQAGPAFSEDDPVEPELSAIAFVPSDPTRFADTSTCAVRDSVFGLAILDNSCRPYDQPALTPEQLDFVASRTPNLASAVGIAEPEGASNIDPFFSLSFAHELDHGSLFASWTRSDSESQGLGSATTSNVFRMGLSYEPIRRWSTNASFTFSRRTTDLEQELVFPVARVFPTFELVDGPLAGLMFNEIAGAILRDGVIFQESDTMTLRFSVVRYVGRWSNVFFDVTMRRLETRSEFEVDGSSAGLSESGRDGYQFRIGFNYRFRPIRF